MIRRLACGTLLTAVAFAVVSVERTAWGADGVGSRQGLVAAKSRWKHKGLPRFYAKVVTPEQRDTILKIQEEYRPKIEAMQAKIDELKTQMKALTKERDGKIEAVLTPEQKKQVDEAAAKAKEKSQEKKDKKNATEPAKPADKPAEKRKAPDAAAEPKPSK